MPPKQNNQLYLDVNLIDASTRVRADYGDMEQLVRSVDEYGLIHPVVVDQNKKLIAGGRRLKAYKDLGATEIPIVYYETLDDLQLQILEVEENVVRKDFDWKERVLAIANVHSAAKLDAILNKRMKRWAQEQTGDLLGISAGNMSNALMLAKFIQLGDKEVIASLTMREAFQVITLRKEKQAQKLLVDYITAKANSSTAVNRKEVDELLAATHSTTDGFFSAVGSSGGGITAPIVDEMPGQASAIAPSLIPLSKLCQHGDCRTLMSLLPEESVDHIITDIPYGIDMDNLSNVEEVEAEHDVEQNIELFTDFMDESFRVLKPNAYNIFFCDVHHWEKLREAAYAVGYKVQRWPLVWHKTSSCSNKASQVNFTKNYEIAMVLRKGTPTLVQPMSSSIWSGPNSDQLDHSFAKPKLLWQWLLGAVAISGQTVLDPFAGVGSFALSAIDRGIVPVSFEINENHYNKLIESVSNAYKALNPSVQFV